MPWYHGKIRVVRDELYEVHADSEEDARMKIPRLACDEPEGPKRPQGCFIERSSVLQWEMREAYLKYRPE